MFIHLHVSVFTYAVSFILWSVKVKKRLCNKDRASRVLPWQKRFTCGGSQHLEMLSLSSIAYTPYMHNGILFPVYHCCGNHERSYFIHNLRRWEIWLLTSTVTFIEYAIKWRATLVIVKFEYNTKTIYKLCKNLTLFLTATFFLII